MAGNWKWLENAHILEALPKHIKANLEGKTEVIEGSSQGATFVIYCNNLLDATQTAYDVHPAIAEVVKRDRERFAIQRVRYVYGDKSLNVRLDYHEFVESLAPVQPA